MCETLITMANIDRHLRSAYPHFEAITTRWSDNDAYAHVNNVVYYSFFDTAVNAFLIRAGALRLGPASEAVESADSSIGLVVQTHCDFFESLAFPDVVQVGIRVAKIGNSSVCYELAVFKNAEPLAVAQGHFIHVYVGQKDRKTRALSAQLRSVLVALIRPATTQSFVISSLGT
jgi:acyl-CoA thioester hydrolase